MLYFSSQTIPWCDEAGNDTSPVLVCAGLDVGVKK